MDGNDTLGVEGRTIRYWLKNHLRFSGYVISEGRLFLRICDDRSGTQRIVAKEDISNLEILDTPEPEELRDAPGRQDFGRERR